jgi:hypothetical protein
MKNNTLDYAAQIEASNAAFKKMSQARKRVQIAKDVIAGLKAKKLKAMRGSYIKVKGDSRYFNYKPFNDGSFKEALKDIPECEVCVKGAIFTCIVARRNQVPSNAEQLRHPYPENWTGEKLAPLLGDIFSADQLRLIEAHFEEEDIESTFGDSKLTKIQVPLSDYLYPEDRMIGIMENIIANKGTFIP